MSTDADKLTHDLLIHDTSLVATMDQERREIRNGWITVKNGVISAIGTATDKPPAKVGQIRRNQLT